MLEQEDMQDLGRRVDFLELEGLMQIERPRRQPPANETGKFHSKGK